VDLSNPGSIVLLGTIGALFVLMAVAVGAAFLRSPRAEPPAGATTGEDRLADGLVGPDARAGDRPLDDDVEFTVYRPGRAAPEGVNQLLFFAHLGQPRPDAPPGTPSPRQIVEKQAAEALGEDQASAYQATSGVPASRPVPRDELLTVMPLVEGCAFEPVQAALRWRGPVHRLDFRFTVQPGMEGADLRGAVLVQFLGTVVLAEIPVVVHVGDDAVETLVPTPPVRPYRRIFPSYSRRDSAVIEAFRHYAAAFGDEYLQDVLRLRSGEDWRQRLRELIDQADVFQLFWSTASSGSDEVRLEWSHALSLDRPGFIRPLAWEDPLPPIPEPLQDLHFTRLTLPDLEAERDVDRRASEGPGPENTGQMAAPRPGPVAAPYQGPADPPLQSEAPARRKGGGLGSVAFALAMGATGLAALLAFGLWPVDLPNQPPAVEVVVESDAGLVVGVNGDTSIRWAEITCEGGGSERIDLDGGSARLDALPGEGCEIRLDGVEGKMPVISGRVRCRVIDGVLDCP